MNQTRPMSTCRNILPALVIFTVSGNPFQSCADDSCGATQGPIRFSGLIESGDVLPPLARIEAMASGWRHGVAVLGDGSLAFWGQNFSGQCTPPSGVGFGDRKVTSVDAGQSHTISLLMSGEVVCWGSDVFGQCAVPDDLIEPGNPVVQVAAGNNFSAALRADGSVRQWGLLGSDCHEVPADAENPIIRIQCGPGRTLGVRKDGEWSLLCTDLLPEPPESMSDVIVFGNDASAAYVLGLTDTGSVFSVYGNNWVGPWDLASPAIHIKGCGSRYAIQLDDGKLFLSEVNSSSGDIDSDSYVDAPDLRNGLSTRVNIELGLDFLMSLVDEGDCDGSGLSDTDEIAAGIVDDCDGDGVIDACASAAGLVPDCDGNQVPDSCDIAAGADDRNGNGIPDGCEFARGDFNLDGCVDGEDLGRFFAAWGDPDSPVGDLDGNGRIDGVDLGLLLTHWGCG